MCSAVLFVLSVCSARRMTMNWYNRVCVHLIYLYSSLSSSFTLFLLLPELAFVPGPQCGVGFCWYRTSLMREEGVTKSGRFMKSVSALAGLDNSWWAGDVGEIFSILTGWSLIQERNRSCISCLVAVVLSDPGQACDLETLCPEFNRPDLTIEVGCQVWRNSGKWHLRDVV
jgi:hypothetical protein